MLSIASILIDGVTVDLATVAADVTIRVGRSSYYDSATPSSCQLTLLGATRELARSVTLSRPLIVNYAVGAPNLVPNPGFETDAAGWVGGGATFARSTVQSHSGVASCAMTSAGGSVEPTPPPGVTPGHTYKFGAWVYVPVASGITLSSVFLYLMDYVDGVGYEASPSAGPTAFDTWQRLTVTKTIRPAATPQALTRIYAQTPGTMFFDDVEFIEAVVAKPRFTGRTTDATLDGDALTVIAVGRLSTLGGYTVGTVAYAAQGWAARMNTIFFEAGLHDYLSMPALGGPPDLIARPIGPVSLAEYLDELLEVGSAVASDLPDGRILIEPSDTRTAANPIVVGSDKVLLAPSWEKVLPGANKATVGWGTATPQAETTRENTAAAAQYGPRLYSLVPSAIAYQVSAEDFAQKLVNRQAVPRWSTPAATLLEGVDLHVGKALKFSDVPPPAPYSIWTAIIEGWTDSIASDGERLTWTTEVALSDPNLSGVIVSTAWEDLPPTDLWSTIDPTVSWVNADALAP